MGGSLTKLRKNPIFCEVNENIFGFFRKAALPEKLEPKPCQTDS